MSSEPSFGDQLKGWWARTFVQKQAEKKVEQTAQTASKQLEKTFQQKGLSQKLVLQRKGIYNLITHIYNPIPIPIKGFTFTKGQRLIDAVVAHNIKSETDNHNYYFLFRTAVQEADTTLKSYAYIGTLIDQNILTLENHSSGQHPFATIEGKNCQKNARIIKPTDIATDGKSFFYKAKSVDDLYAYYHGKCKDEPTWISKQYGGYFFDLTTSSLQALVGDTDKGNLFYGSAAPNLYSLNQTYKSKLGHQPSIFEQAGESFKEITSTVVSNIMPGTKIVEKGYLIDANEGTLIYGRMFNYESWFDEIKRKTKNKLQAFGNKVLPAGWVDAPRLEEDKMYRIGYYAKFFGDSEPSEITDTEDSEECKMLSSVETVLFGNPIKYYNMVPGAASKDFATIFLGRSRGIHIAIQRKMGELFPNMLSWYKILKTQLHVQGSFLGRSSEWTPENIIPRQLFIVRQNFNGQEFNYLFIVTQKNVFLMYTPLEKVSKLINENYNVILANLYSAGPSETIITSSLYDNHQANNQQIVYAIVENETVAKEEEEIYTNAYSIIPITNLESILQEIKDSLVSNNAYDSDNLQWKWVGKKERQEKRKTKNE
jgi:hypothetical protein